MKTDRKLIGSKGGWTVEKTRKIFENPFFAVFEDEVIKPDGGQGTYATITFNTGASVLPIDDDRNVYLTRQYRYAIGREDIEALAGSVDGESALDAAKRETKEELGIEADEWIDLGNIQSITSITRSNSRHFIARGLSFGRPENEGTENIESVKLSLDQAYKMVLDGEITDSDTCILIMKAYSMYKKMAAG
jgi:ADP-ribose pyrophosphatase